MIWSRETPENLPISFPVLLALIDESIKWWAQKDLNLRPIDYEAGGESGGTLLKGRIARPFLDIDFGFEAVRAYTEPRMKFRPIRIQHAEG